MHHGDQQNADEDGGALSTASVRYRKEGSASYIRMLKESAYGMDPTEDDALTLFQEMNDVRPAGSTPMVWWYQAAALVAVVDGGTQPGQAPRPYERRAAVDGLGVGVGVGVGLG